MITLTLEALYTLHMFNDHSDDLVFLPLSDLKAGGSRKDQLTRTVKKGFADLEKVGLIENNEPTQDCVRLGYLLGLYADNYYHFQIDDNYFCAPGVDPKFKRMVVVIKRIDENSYVIEYTANMMFLSILMDNHEIFHQLDDVQKDYLKSEWQPYAFMLLIAYHGNTKTIRIRVEQLGRFYVDHLFFSASNRLYEYNLAKEAVRSVSPDEMKEMIVKQMKVEVK